MTSFRFCSGRTLAWTSGLAALLLWSCSLPARAASSAEPERAPAASSSSLEDAPSAVLARADSAINLPVIAVADPFASSRKEQRLEAHDDKYTREAERNTQCEDGELHGKPCRVSWGRVLGSSLIMLAAQHGGNIVMDNETRQQLTGGHFWDNYVYCLQHYRWSRWKDDDPFGVDWIGHPMMGAMTSAIYEQNDPKQRALRFENTHRYWMGRLKAMAYSAVYSAQWKVGPASEASIGNSGHVLYPRQPDGIWTNETGMQDWFVTPIFGMGWNVGEDALDRFVVAHIRHAHPRNRVLLSVASLITPTKTAANITRFRPLYYRDADNHTLDELRPIQR